MSAAPPQKRKLSTTSIPPNPKRARSISSRTSSTHPLRQTSFPLPTSSPSRSPSVESASVAGPGRKRKKGKGKNTGAGAGGAGGAGDDVSSASSSDNEDENEGDAVMLDGGANKKAQDEQDRYRVGILVDSLPAETYDRYTLYLRSTLGKPAIRKLANQVLNQSTTPLVVTTIAGYSKIFVVELVERAREVQSQWGRTGMPLGPDEVREAYRRWLRDGEGSGVVERGRGGGRSLFR